MNEDGALKVDMFEKARAAADKIKEKYGISPELTTHPTSWGNSAYLRARIPGPDGTYVDTGFRLSDHGVGDLRKGTDEFDTIIDGADMTPDSLFARLEAQISSAQPRLMGLAEKKRATEAVRKAWNDLPDSAKRKYKKQAVRERMPGGADIGAFQLFLKDQSGGN